MPQPNRAEYRAMVAALCDHFGLTPQQVGSLTSRQQREVYGHARDREGAITVPPREQTIPERGGSFEEECVQLDLLAAAFNWPLSEVVKLKEDLRRKYDHAGSNGAAAR